ncbi:MAG: ABC transporter ATP-binding protein [Candidatus Calescibacterium sp.]|nr:ABC transporter ATP-binding protein [Candidatus Calescibacterium sp.]MCX7972640.1 ABC transporter ATP-binding protein [bacterium]MDW8194763.1 ABC transporter ATP-binding protein [Candidatus Calescibacterium sp.]
MNTKIKLKNVSKFYKNGDEKILVLNNINLDIFEGDFIVLMGPSGAGKTTLLFIISGLEKPSLGSVYWDDIPIDSLSDSQIQRYKLKKVGLVFQNYYLIPSMTALENVCLPIILLGELSEREAITRAKELLKIVGIEENRFNDLVSKFSGGQMQRIAIARALANNPDIILADEPTGNLDTKNSKKIMELLHKINKELRKTIILATHDPKIAAFSDKVIFIQDGKITQNTYE